MKLFKLATSCQQTVTIGICNVTFIDLPKAFLREPLFANTSEYTKVDPNFYGKQLNKAGCQEAQRIEKASGCKVKKAPRRLTPSGKQTSAEEDKVQFIDSAPKP